MIKLDLQFFGGRGSSSSGWSGGGGLDGGSILSTADMIVERGNNESEVDDVLTVARDIYNEYGVVPDEWQIATLDAKGANVMAYWDGSNIAVNKNYFNSKKMEQAYNDCVKSGFHPSKGSKTGMEATIAHELGHQLTEKVGAKLGLRGTDASAKAILKEATKNSGYRSASKMAGKISGYAKTSPAEAIAEAFSDVYCNGRGAKAESRAIVGVIDKYLK